MTGQMDFHQQKKKKRYFANGILPDNMAEATFFYRLTFSLLGSVAKAANYQLLETHTHTLLNISSQPRYVHSDQQSAVLNVKKIDR